MDLISPNWTGSFGVHAFTTTRDRGPNSEPFAAQNLDSHPANDRDAAERQQERYLANLGLPHSPRWLRQVHGTRTVDAAVHAGWRGLLHGVVESSLRKFSTPTAQLIAWIGPGISRDAYSVDPTFRARFLYADPALGNAFHYSGQQWHADLYAIAEHRLRVLGVENVTRYDGCTFAEPDRLYSYRRDGVTGRMATLVWIDAQT